MKANLVGNSNYIYKKSRKKKDIKRVRSLLFGPVRGVKGRVYNKKATKHDFKL